MLGVGLLEPDRDTTCRRLAPRLGEHRGREIDAGDVMTAGRELEGEEAGAAARIEAWRPPIPMGRDLLLDDVRSGGRHTMLFWATRFYSMI